MKTLLTEAQCKDLLGITASDLLDRFRRYKDDPIPFMRVGGRYRYDEQKVIAWAEAEAGRDPNRPIREKYPWERRKVVAATEADEE